MQTGGGEYGSSYTEVKTPGDGQCRTPEIMGDDGTYGSSGDYIYWWDSRGIYRQLYINGAGLVFVSSEPWNAKGIIINMEIQHE